jgi:hypothetical protein
MLNLVDSLRRCAAHAKQNCFLGSIGRPQVGHGLSSAHGSLAANRYSRTTASKDRRQFSSAILRAIGATHSSK